MQIKNKQVQTIIMISIVVIAMVVFGIFTKHNIDKKKSLQKSEDTKNIDIDLTPRPIEELFASEFSSVGNNNQVTCDKNKILSERDKLVKENKISSKAIGNLKLNDECLWTYEGNDYGFSFKSYGDNVFFLDDYSNKVLSISDYPDTSINNLYVAKDENPNVNQYIDYLIKTFYNHNPGSLGVTKNRKSKRNISKLISLKHYKNKYDVSIYKVSIKDCLLPEGAMSCEYVNRDFIVLGSKNITLFIKNGPPELTRDFLDTIKLVNH